MGLFCRCSLFIFHEVQRRTHCASHHLSMCTWVNVCMPERHRGGEGGREDVRLAVWLALWMFLLFCLIGLCEHLNLSVTKTKQLLQKKQIHFCQGFEVVQHIGWKRNKSQICDVDLWSLRYGCKWMGFYRFCDMKQTKKDGWSSDMEMYFDRKFVMKWAYTYEVIGKQL